jgi:hypothetical protein
VGGRGGKGEEGIGEEAERGKGRGEDGKRWERKYWGRKRKYWGRKRKVGQQRAERVNVRTEWRR